MGGKPRAKPAEWAPKPVRLTKAEQARINGAKGGRPRKDLRLGDFELVGPPPIGRPLELARWVQNLLAIDLYRQVTGRADAKLSSSIRATAGVLNRGIPADIMVEAEKLIREDQGQLDDEGPEVEELDDGGDDGGPSGSAGALNCSTPRG